MESLTFLFKNNTYDNIYGPQKDGNGDWKFGNSKMYLVDDKIKVGNQIWALSVGLYNLLFHKNSAGLDKFKLDVYKNILENTCVHGRNHESTGQIRGNKGPKYTKIIKNCFNRLTQVKDY